MNKTQRLGFILAGSVNLVCGVVMTVLGFVYSVVSLWAVGIGLMVSGMFWIGWATIEARKKHGSQ